MNNYRNYKLPKVLEIENNYNKHKNRLLNIKNNPHSSFRKRNHSLHQQKNIHITSFNHQYVHQQQHIQQQNKILHSKLIRIINRNQFQTLPFKQNKTTSAYITPQSSSSNRKFLHRTLSKKSCNSSKSLSQSLKKRKQKQISKENERVLQKLLTVKKRIDVRSRKQSRELEQRVNRISKLTDQKRDSLNRGLEQYSVKPKIFMPFLCKH